MRDHVTNHLNDRLRILSAEITENDEKINQYYGKIESTKMRNVELKIELDGVKSALENYQQEEKA